MGNGGLQGWCDDPFRLHEARYFSAGRPTKLVRDGGVESYDEPPSETYEPAPVSAAPVTVGAVTVGAVAAGAEVPGRRGRGVPVAVATIAGLAVAAVVVAGMVAGHGSGSSANSSRVLDVTPAAFVAQSAERTMAERTADLTISGTAQAAGHSTPLYGTGETNFGTGAMALDTSYSLSGHVQTEKEIQVGGSLYFTFRLDGKSVAQLPAYSKWVQMPLGKQSALASLTDLTGGDPLASLPVLEQQGGTVRGLGTKIVGGVSCVGYAVTPSMYAFYLGFRDEMAKLGASMSGRPPTDRELNQLRGKPSPVTVMIWIDSQRLVREMSLTMKMGASVNSANITASVNVVMDFSNFGAPVTITAPAPADTISYSTFMQNPFG